MKISRKSKRHIDQAFVEGQGWIEIRPSIPLRRLWWKRNKLRKASAVKFVGLGDYKVSELLTREAANA